MFTHRFSFILQDALLNRQAHDSLLFTDASFD